MSIQPLPPFLRLSATPEQPKPGDDDPAPEPTPTPKTPDFPNGPR